MNKQNFQLKENDSIVFTIKRLGINGEGIGFYKRQVVFVNNALPGKLNVHILESVEGVNFNTLHIKLNLKKRKIL